MTSKRRRFSGEQKAKIALEALRSDWTLQEIASQCQVQPNQVGAWKRQAGATTRTSARLACPAGRTRGRSGGVSRGVPISERAFCLPGRRP